MQKLIEVQAYIIFLAAAFFTVLYLFMRVSNPQKSANWLGIFGAVSWIVEGFLWLFLAAESSPYSTYSVALLFNGFGIFMIVYIVIDLLQIGRSNRELGEVGAD